ncbi:MAG: cation diffusion facilitator family transporter, partial [Gaiellaceae bacterium]
MSPQRRIALVSVAAAVVLIGLKLVTGLATGSLGLLSEAAHSGTDLVAALLTLFAVGVAVRPADRSHPYGHGKAEHLAALAEASILALISLLLAAAAIRRLVDGTFDVDVTWYALLVIGVVIVIDASRAAVSRRASRKFQSPAFAASALHFAGDLAGSTAVLLGLLAARAGYPEGDAAAALFVAALVLVAAVRLMRRNVDVLMDQAPVNEVAAARSAIEQLEP